MKIIFPVLIMPGALKGESVQEILPCTTQRDFIVYKKRILCRAYYFDMEGYKIGEKADPAIDKLITIQYQKMT